MTNEGDSHADVSDVAPVGAGKVAWRAVTRSRRAALMTPRERAERLSAAVAAGIAASEEFRSATTVLTYLAFGSEVDPGALIPAAAVRFAVPLSHSLDSQLTFHLLDDAKLSTSRSGLREPLAAAPQVPLDAVDLVLVPGLAFDITGARLGYGKGFYDRFLAQLAMGDRAVPTFGVTLDELVYETLPTDPHDMRVSHLATQTGVRPV